MKREPTEWGFARYTEDRGLISRTYKELKVKLKKMTHLRIGPGTSTQSSQRKKKNGQEISQKISSSLEITENTNQNNYLMRTANNQMTYYRSWRDVKQGESSFVVGGAAQCCSTMGISVENSQKADHRSIIGLN